MISSERFEPPFETSGRTTRAKQPNERPNIVLDRLDGAQAEATGLDPAELPHVGQLVEEFRRAALNVDDATVFRYEEAHACKFIDITTAFGAALQREV